MKLGEAIGKRHMVHFASSSARLIEIIQKELERSFCDPKVTEQICDTDGYAWRESRMTVMATDEEIKMAVFNARPKWFIDAAKHRCNMVKAFQIWREVKVF